MCRYLIQKKNMVCAKCMVQFIKRSTTPLGLQELYINIVAIENK